MLSSNRPEMLSRVSSRALASTVLPSARLAPMLLRATRLAAARLPVRSIAPLCRTYKSVTPTYTPPVTLSGGVDIRLYPPSKVNSVVNICPQSSAMVCCASLHFSWFSHLLVRRSRTSAPRFVCRVICPFHHSALRLLASTFRSYVRLLIAVVERFGKFLRTVKPGPPALFACCLTVFIPLPIVWLCWQASSLHYLSSIRSNMCTTCAVQLCSLLI
jgi:hypothetical protein